MLPVRKSSMAAKSTDTHQSEAAAPASAAAAPASHAPAAPQTSAVIAMMQRTHGNEAVQHLVETIRQQHQLHTAAAASTLLAAVAEPSAEGVAAPAAVAAELAAEGAAAPVAEGGAAAPAVAVAEPTSDDVAASVAAVSGPEAGGAAAPVAVAAGPEAGGAAAPVAIAAGPEAGGAAAAPVAVAAGPEAGGAAAAPVAIAAGPGAGGAAAAPIAVVAEPEAGGAAAAPIAVAAEPEAGGAAAPVAVAAEPEAGGAAAPVAVAAEPEAGGAAGPVTSAAEPEAGGGADASVAAVAEPEAGGAAAAPVQSASPASAGLGDAYGQAASWLEAQAANQGQTALYQRFAALTTEQQKAALQVMGGAGQFSEQLVKDKMTTSTLGFKKRVDWTRFTASVASVEPVKLEEAAGPAESQNEEGGEKDEAPQSAAAIDVSGLLVPYKDIVLWLNYKANKQGKAGLMQFFETLSLPQKQVAIQKMAGTDKPDFKAFTEKISTRSRLKKRVDWDVFSTAAREAKGMKMDNYNKDTNIDYTGYGITGTGATVSAAGAGSTVAKLAGDSGGAASALVLAPFSSGLSALGAAVSVGNAVNNYDSSMSTFDKAHTVGVGVGAGLADIAQSTSQTVETARAALGHTAASAATAAAGGAAIATGAINLIGGTATAIKSQQRKNALQNMNTQGDAVLERAADVGVRTQEINRNVGVGTAVKGAALLTGGILLLTASGPIGWILLGAAGAIAGAVAIYKFYKKRARKHEVVDRYLKLDKVPEGEKEKQRDGKLQQNGFNSVDQCYVHIITELANIIYEKGVVGDEENYMDLIQHIGLKREKGKSPTPSMIAKKLN
ncbi:hypothetical protein [Paenibacillus thalictri]|uniref:Uncharacterized protein n=1 Tax=Paenibacillus thalictri TaxID=2527873 RepID=A0A4Q9DWP9_9BACL|nr:hypothetical protein [Paenibacillus thalictri]TBL80785.1 hypothetical protein EYB31_06060 [Paenibacillus thalictri]